MKKPIAIDPVGCGCTECLTGLYIPLELAKRKQIKAMLKGKLRNHTGENFVKKTQIVSEYSGRQWEWEDRIG